MDNVGLFEGDDVGLAVAHGAGLAVGPAQRHEGPGELEALDELVGGVETDRAALDEVGHREESVGGGWGGSGHVRDRSSGRPWGNRRHLRGTWVAAGPRKLLKRLW